VETQNKSTFESIKVDGGQLIDSVKKLIHEGNVRRIVISQEGKTIVEFPLTLGLVGAAVAPVLAAIGTIAALVTECTITVERDSASPPQGTNGASNSSTNALPPSTT
jgi:hypothetical protein